VTFRLGTGKSITILNSVEILEHEIASISIFPYSAGREASIKSTGPAGQAKVFRTC
jgi:hypothetical protein